jgi:hypothetical protein
MVLALFFQFMEQKNQKSYPFALAIPKNTMFLCLNQLDEKVSNVLLCLDQLDKQASNALLCLDQLDEQASNALLCLVQLDEQASNTLLCLDQLDEKASNVLLCLDQLEEQASNALLCLNQLNRQAKHFSVLLAIAKTPCYKVDNFAERGFLLSNKGCLLWHQQLSIHNSQFTIQHLFLHKLGCKLVFARCGFKEISTTC